MLSVTHPASFRNPKNVIVSGFRQDRWHENAVAAPLAISSSIGIDDIGGSSTRVTWTLR